MSMKINYKSDEFVIGYLFNEIEESVVRTMNRNQISKVITIPSWWSGNAFNSTQAALLRCNLMTALLNVLVDRFKDLEITAELFDQPDIDLNKYRIIFTRKVTKKKLTVSQIEEKLGYKIEIVSEDKEWWME